MLEAEQPPRYIEVVCGKFNVMENYGQTTFMKLVRRGVAFCEFSHPNIHGMTPGRARQRVYELDHNRIGAIIHGVDPVHEHKQFIGLQLTISPVGPYGPMVQEMIDSGKPVKLGLRGIKHSNGELKDIITFDLINPE